MRNFYILAFILALPALAALGHDAYVAYNNTHLEVADRFYFSDLGWLWVNYSPNSYDWILDNVDSVIWNGVFDPILQKTAFYVLSTPFIVFLIFSIFMKIFGLGSFEGNGFLTSSFSSGKKTGGEKSKRAKYSRK